MYSTNQKSGCINVRFFFTILGCKTLQALSFCVKIEATEIEKEEAYEISRAQ